MQFVRRAASRSGLSAAAAAARVSTNVMLAWRVVSFLIHSLIAHGQVLR
jgi:hypothetical protein